MPSRLSSDSFFITICKLFHSQNDCIILSTNRNWKGLHNLRSNKKLSNGKGVKNIISLQYDFTANKYQNYKEALILGKARQEPIQISLKKERGYKALVQTQCYHAIVQQMYAKTHRNKWLFSKGLARTAPNHVRKRKVFTNYNRYQYRAAGERLKNYIQLNGYTPVAHGPNVSAGFYKYYYLFFSLFS